MHELKRLAAETKFFSRDWSDYVGLLFSSDFERLCVKNFLPRKKTKFFSIDLVVLCQLIFWPPVSDGVSEELYVRKKTSRLLLQRPEPTTYSSPMFRTIERNNSNEFDERRDRHRPGSDCG
jgi:hypothetical protein